MQAAFMGNDSDDTPMILCPLFDLINLLLFSFSLTL